MIHVTGRPETPDAPGVQSALQNLSSILRQCMGATDEDGRDVDIGGEVRRVRIALDEYAARIAELEGERDEYLRDAQQNAKWLQEAGKQHQVFLWRIAELERYVAEDDIKIEKGAARARRRPPPAGAYCGPCGAVSRRRG